MQWSHEALKAIVVGIGAWMARTTLVELVFAYLCRHVDSYVECNERTTVI
jgi:hypothetical protein